jgi:cytochrome c-type biogenesis protein CcmH/NrfG
MATLSASVADSAKDMLAAGRIDEAIAELNGRLSSSPADAESSNLLCRAYFALEDWNRAESSCKKAVALDPATAVSICGWGACTAKRRIGQISWPRRSWRERFAENSSARCN